MHIQEGTNTTLTTCTKMTEEVDRRHGVNGNSSSKGVNDDPPIQNSAPAASGGRLKFFKDGKFILELVRGSERAGWVSVPRKTFWPPAAAPPTPPLAPAPCASLSLSDDNSSLHSSPSTSHRDHCWKQPSPRRNLSKELAMYYCRPSTLHSAQIRAASRLKRRRPTDPSLLDAPNGTVRKPLANGLCDAKRNGDVPPTDDKSCKGENVPDGPVDTKSKPDNDRTDSEREKYYHMKLKKPYQYHKLRVYRKTKPPTKRKELARVVEKLREKIASLPVLVNAKLANCRQEHMMVSPRKRILREMERVSLSEDHATKRRAKTVPTLSTASYPPSPGPSHTPHAAPLPAPQRPAEVRAPNGAAARKDAAVTKNVSSYSIHSLLSMPDDAAPRRSPDAKRSPHSYPASLKTESPSSVRSPDLSPSPDSYRYRYGVARDSPPPGPGAGPGAGARAGYAAAYGRGAGRAARDEWPPPYVYGYAYPPLYRPPAPLWVHYAPPGAWPPLAHPLLTDHLPKDEPTSDLPLNLSKH